MNEPFALHPSDTDTTVLWEEHLGRYVMYTRMFESDRRWIGRAEAVDFREWSPAVWDAFDTGWASWQRDRICAVVADGEGEFWTQPVVLAARGIRLNFRAPTAGEIRVGIEGVAGRSADNCDPLAGDETERVVTWGGDCNPLTGVEGEPVALHIRMRCAKLFSVDLF